MTSITEDPSLPLDLDGTSNQLSNSSHFGNHDMTDHDVTSSISSEIEHPGTFPNLTSAGKMSPHRTRTMKDQETQLGEYKKENFGLKLRIYHLEEALRKKWGDSEDGWKMNIELQVQMSNMKKELADKDALLMQAKSAIDQMAAQHDAHIREMQRAAEASTQTEELEELKKKIGDREADLEEALRETEENCERMRDMQELNEKLEDDLRDKEYELGRMERELEELQKALETTAAHPPPVATYSTACQTTEPLAAQLAQATRALEAAQSQLEDKNRETAELKLAMADKDKHIKDLEIELLSSSHKLAAGADDHGREMQDQISEMDRCKARLRDLEDKVRQKDDELQRKGAELEGAGRQAREAEALVQRLQPLVQDRDREIQDLLSRLSDAENKGRENERDRDGEIRDLNRKLREAESRAGQSEPELAAKQREIDRLAQALDDKEDELARLRSKVRETEEALSHARKSAHKANIDNREQSEALKRLQEELEELREELRRQRDGKQTDLEAALAAKNAVLEQLRRELRDLQAKLDEAEEKILHLTTSRAAEVGVLRSTIDDLNRQIEHLERLNRDLRNEMGKLTGEKASLEREVEKLRDEIRSLRDQLAALENELAERNKNLAQAEQAIADLQKVIDDLQQQEHKQSGVSEAELAQLRSQLAALGHALRNKEAEVESLKATISLKDGMIKELQDQLAKVMADRARLEERIRELMEEKNKLENELAMLRSQARISKLAADDLQSKLTQAFGEREELARKLQLAEAALRDKEAANGQFQSMCDRLREQIKQLQRQIEELSHHPPPQNVTITTHETTTTHEATDGQGEKEKGGEAKGASSTTMIFGSLSENLLLTILQRLQELYGEITAGRADTSIATSSLSSKLEHITELQRHLESSLHDGQQHSQQEPATSNPNSNNTSYTAYYFMRDEEDGESSVDGKHTARESSTPKKSSPKRKTTSELVAALRDATGQIESLQGELDEVKQWNEELQARLQDKDGSGVSVNYHELEKEVDRLLAELDAERERSQAERDHQQQELDALHDQLKNTEDKVQELEQQLRQAMMRDDATSTDTLQQEVDRLVKQLDEARASVAALRGRLDAERNESSQLRAEISDLRHGGLNDSPQSADKETMAASSMPNLLLSKSMSDSWTSPARASQSMSEQPDVRALKQKHEEVTRLNQELQRKCREQLYRSPPHSRPSSGSHSSTIYWQGKLREQEESLRSEMLERERGLLARIRESEARLIERDAEWKHAESALRRQIVDLEARLSEAVKSGEQARRKYDELLVECQVKDEEIKNLSRSLSKSQEKIQALEEQLDLLLREKNTVINDLEEKVHVLEGELRGAQEREERLRHTVEVLEKGADVETEVTTLHETVDSLTQQLTSRIEDVEELQGKNRSLEEQRSILNSQLASAHEQIRMLKEELTLYQKLVEDRTGGTGADKTGNGRPDISLSVEKVLQLLEEIRKLREQLDQSIHSNNALAEQLQSRLDQSQSNSETTIHYSSHATPLSGRATSTQTSPSKDDSPRRFTRGTSPTRVRLSTKSTNTRVPSSDKSTGTKGQSAKGQTTTRTDHNTLYVHHDSDTTTPPSFSETKLSDTSTSSLSQQHSPSTHHRPTANVSTSTSFAHPKDTSTPHINSRHTSTHSRFTGSSTNRTGGLDHSFTDSAYTERGVNTEEPSPPSQRRGRSGEQQPQSSTSSRYTHVKTTTTTRRTQDQLGSGSDESGASPRGRRPTSADRGASGGGGHTTSFTLSGMGDFDSLETRLQQALNSPSLLAADRTFLEDLLVYLRQQRKQLDESRRLLERLEQSTGIPSTTHIHVDTADSGTLPTPPHHMTATGSTQATPRNVHCMHSNAQTTPLHGTHVHMSAQTTPLHGTHSSAQTTPLHGTHSSAQTTPLHSTHSSAQTTPLHGTHSGTQATPLHGTHASAQTTPLHGTHSSTRATPLHVGRKTHTSSSYSFRSEATKVPQFSSSPGLATSGASMPESYSDVGPTRVTKATNGDGEGGAVGRGDGEGGAVGSGRGTRVDLSKLYEQLLQTHSSLAEARSALNHQRTQ